MKKRRFSRECKIEAVRLVTDRGIAVGQACRDLELSESVLRRPMREFNGALSGAFSGHGRPGQEQAALR